MGGPIASVQVKEELKEVQVKLAEHEVLHQSNNRTLEKVSEAVINQVRISEQIVALDRRHETSAKVIHKRLDTLALNAKEMDAKVDNNHTQIVKWSGGLGSILAVVSIVGVALSAIKIFTS